MAMQIPDRYRPAFVWVSREIDDVIYRYPVPGFTDPDTGRHLITREVSVYARDHIAAWTDRTPSGALILGASLPIVEYPDSDFGTPVVALDLDAPPIDRAQRAWVSSGDTRSTSDYEVDMSING